MQTLAVLLVAVLFTALLIAISRSWSRWPEPRGSSDHLEVQPLTAEQQRLRLMAGVIASDHDHRR